MSCSLLLRRSFHVTALLLALPALDATARERLAFNADWRFQLGDEPAAAQPEFSDATWRTLAVPHDWSIEGERRADAPAAGGGGFFPTGIGWYRRTFDAPTAWRGQRVSIEFEGVYMHAEVWLNGARLGVQPYGYTAFRFDLTPHLRLGTKNVLAVRVDNARQPNARWYTGSGIHRPVWLDVVAPVHVALDGGVFVTTAAPAKAGADLRAEVTVRNASPRRERVQLAFIVRDERGRVVPPTTTGDRTLEIDPHGTGTITIPLHLARAQYWSPDTPALYRLETRVTTTAGTTSDIATTTFGIRTVAVSAARGFLLNDEPIELAGGNVHHDHGPLGAASFAAAEERRVRLLKAAGFNAVRTAHNPPSRAFLEACDRLGLLVLDEAFDGWARRKVAQDYSVFFPEWWRHDLAALVRRDRHHPSVVMWSIGNEVYERGAASGAQLAAEMRALIHELDTSRPITAGINGLGATGDWTRLDPLFTSLDVAGYNYELAHHAADHARLPERVIYSAESYLKDTFAGWAATHDHPYVIGDFVWTALDYLGEAGIGRVFPPGEKAVPHWEGVHFPWHGAACGEIDVTGWRKPVSHYRNIVWDRGEKLYAAVLAPTPAADGTPWSVSAWAMPPALPSWTWPGHEGRELQIEVCSRHDAVRLFLNRKPLGEKPTTRAEEFKAKFTVPYAAGELRVVGVRDGREVESFTLATAGGAAQIRLTAEPAPRFASEQDVVHVVVEIADASGRWRPDADHAITCAVSGPATIAGIGSGDMASAESYNANPRRVFQGRALVVLRSTGERGRVVLTASAPGLKPATVTLQAR